MRKILVLMVFCLLGADLFAGPIDELMVAAESGNTAEVERLVSSGVDIDVQINGKTALMVAAWYGQTETVAKLVEMGANIEAVNGWRRTALMYAAEAGRTETVIKLVELGADVIAKDGFGRTAMDRAREKGQTETIDKLKELMVDELMEAAGDGKVLKVEKIISSGIDVNSKESTGLTALMFAAMADQVEMVEKLVELGADLEIKDVEGVTAFKWAETYDNAETIAKLRELGAKGYLQKELMDAAAEGNIPEVEKIIASGVDVNSTNRDWMTPLMFAAVLGRTETALKLIELGADATLRDRQSLSAAKWAMRKGQTGTAIAIIKASLNGQKPTVERLKALGVDADKMDKVMSVIISEDSEKEKISKAELLTEDTRASLRMYVGENEGVSDEELVVRTLSKISEGLSTKDGSSDHIKALSFLARESHLEFMSSVKFEKYASVYQDYVRAVSAINDFVSFNKNSQGSSRPAADLIKESGEKIEKIKIEVSRFRTLK